MTLVIDLTPEEEARLQAIAKSQGLEPADCAKRLLTERLTPPKPGAGTLALFAQWDAEDGTADPEEIAARTRDWEEFKRNLEANPFTLRTLEP